MANFNMVCPMNYPNKCNLSDVERKHLERPEKYKGFFLYQFQDNDSFLIEAINQYFKAPDFYIFDAAIEPGTGIKICKICKLALAADFGIVSLSPENLNVFMEIGMMFGLRKPCLMLYNKEKLKYKDPDKLPFDINAFINIEYGSKDDLIRGFKRETQNFISKLRRLTDAQAAIRDNLVKKIQSLPVESLVLLKKFVGEGKREFTVSEFLKWQKDTIHVLSIYPEGEMFDEIRWSQAKADFPLNNLIGKFLKESKDGSITKVILMEGYRDFLEEYLWSEEYEELLKNKSKSSK